MKSFLVAIFVLFISTTVYSHECVTDEDELSFHFKSVSLIKTLHLISSYSDRDLVIKTKRDLDIVLHYNCVKWQEIIEDLERNYNYKIHVNNQSITLSD